MAKELVVKLTMDSKEFEAALKKAGIEVESVKGKAEEGETSFFKLAGAFALGEIAASAFKKAIAFVSDELGQAVRGAIEAEKAEIGLATALAARGKLTTETMNQSKALATEMSRLSKFTDEEFLASQQLMVGIGGLATEALPAASRAAADLASFMGVDLRQASLLVSKAAAGNEEALGRLGIKLKDGIPEGEKFAEVMRLIQEKMGGAAAAEAGSFGGMVDQLTKSWHEVLEQIGRFITESPSLRALIDSLTQIFQMWADALNDSNDGMDQLEGIVSVAIPVLRALLAVMSGIAVAFRAVMIAGNGLAMVLEVVISGFKQMWIAGKFVAEAIGIVFSNMSNIIKRVWLNVQESILKAMATITEKAAKVAGIFSDDLYDALRDFSDGAKMAAKEVNAEIGTIPKVADQVGEAFQKAGKESQAEFADMKATIGELDKNVQMHVEGINKIAEAYVRADDVLKTTMDRASKFTGPKLPENKAQTAPTAAAPADFLKVTEDQLASIREATRRHQAAIQEIKAEGSKHDREIERASATETQDRLRELEVFTRVQQEKLKAAKDTMSADDFARNQKSLEDYKAYQGSLIQAEQDHALLQQELQDGQSEKGRALRQAQLEETNSFLAQLSESFGLTGTMMADLFAAWTTTAAEAGVSMAHSIADSMSDAIFIAVKGGGDIAAVWQGLADTLLKTVIKALVQMAAQWVISLFTFGAASKALAASEIGNNLARVFSGAFAATAMIPYVGPILAPGVAAASLALAAAGTVGAKAVGTGIGSFAEGSDFIDSTGMAQIHRGERVVPSQTNLDLTEFLRSQQQGSGGTRNEVHITVGEMVGDQESVDRLVKAIDEAINLRNARFD